MPWSLLMETFLHLHAGWWHPPCCPLRSLSCCKEPWPRRKREDDWEEDTDSQVTPKTKWMAPGFHQERLWDAMHCGSTSLLHAGDAHQVGDTWSRADPWGLVLHPTPSQGPRGPVVPGSSTRRQSGMAGWRGYMDIQHGAEAVLSGHYLLIWHPLWGVGRDFDDNNNPSHKGWTRIPRSSFSFLNKLWNTVKNYYETINRFTWVMLLTLFLKDIVYFDSEI